jgi:hypothetical protein
VLTSSGGQEQDLGNILGARECRHPTQPFITGRHLGTLDATTSVLEHLRLQNTERTVKIFLSSTYEDLSDYRA